jgi:hypothetical protein
MFSFLAKLLAGPILSKVFDLFKLYKEGKLNELEVRAEVERAVLETISDVAKTQADVIEAEMRGENWLQRNWRPMSAIGFAFIPIFYGLIMPVMVAWFGFAPVRVGDILLLKIIDLVTICLGGYIGFRSVEKVAKYFFRG